METCNRGHAHILPIPSLPSKPLCSFQTHYYIIRKTSKPPIRLKLLRIITFLRLLSKFLVFQAHHRSFVPLAATAAGWSISLSQVLLVLIVRINFSGTTLNLIMGVMGVINTRKSVSSLTTPSSRYFLTDTSDMIDLSPRSYPQSSYPYFRHKVFQQHLSCW